MATIVSAVRPPFTPFVNGPPQFEPGLQRIEMDDWLLPDTEAAIALPAKADLFASRRDEVFAALPGSEAGQAEARGLVIKALGQADTEAKEPELLAASRLVSDDLCLMEPQNGIWVLSAASLAAPTHFLLHDTLGKSLAALHQPVPDGAPVLANKINMMFDRIPPYAVFQRFNWTIQVGNTRFIPDARVMRRRALATPVDQARKVLHLRVERQTILRMPETGSVLFCIRICIDPLYTLNSAMALQLSQAWTEASKRVRAYKKWHVFDHLMADFIKQVQFSGY